MNPLLLLSVLEIEVSFRSELVWLWIYDRVPIDLIYIRKNDGVLGDVEA